MNNENRKFELGKLFMTRGVADRLAEDASFRHFVQISLGRYVQCDWGSTCDEDKKANSYALENGERILAVYKKKDVTVWIITEWDRSSTTILFPEEY